MDIFDYLCKKAKEISDSSLSDIKSKEDWESKRRSRYDEFLEMLGISEYIRNRGELRARITGKIEEKDLTIYKLYYESLPKLYVTGNLYVPKSLKEKAPAVLYLSGHARDQKYHYQEHPRNFAKLGFVSLIVETIQLGEIPGYHHGTYSYGMFNWYSLGYTPTGVEVLNAVRAIDFLQSRSEVDPNRIGVTGISGGGAMSWFTAAVDSRVKVVAPVCGTATIESHVCKRTINGHCDCMFWINTYMRDLSDIGALIAPRPLLIVSTKRDWIFDINSVRKIYLKLKKLYDILGYPDNIELLEAPGPHSYSEESKRVLFKWFLRHLKGESKEPKLVLGRPISSDLLRVFDKYPTDERVTTVQEWFIRTAPPPIISSSDDLINYKNNLVKTLLEKTFRSFPKKEELNTKVELEQEEGSMLGYLISFNVENDWRIYMQIVRDKSSGNMVILAPLDNGLTLKNWYKVLNGLNKKWARAILEVRGTGLSSWSKEAEWFIRRSAMLTGRTLASMRVYDILRAVGVLRSLKFFDKIGLFGDGDMAAVVLYAALLDGNIDTVILKDPPPTQNIVSHKDGTGNIVEMLNCLRYTDLPYIAGALWPTRLIFLGIRPKTYIWTEEIYEKLGEPGEIIHIKDLSQLS